MSLINRQNQNINMPAIIETPSSIWMQGQELWTMIGLVILTMGIMVLLIVLGILLPIFDLNSLVR